ncbi:MAG: DUF6531 domain-containing protein [Actinomycetota bacterium]
MSRAKTPLQFNDPVRFYATCNFGTFEDDRIIRSVERVTFDYPLSQGAETNQPQPLRINFYDVADTNQVDFNTGGRFASFASRVRGGTTGFRNSQLDKQFLGSKCQSVVLTWSPISDLNQIFSSLELCRQEPPPILVPQAQLFGDCGTPYWGHRVATTACANDPVNTATGNFHHAATDASLPGVGVSFSFARSYNSKDESDGGFGRGGRPRMRFPFLPSALRPKAVETKLEARPRVPA